jgi:DNA polymerase III subunit delta'
MLIGHDAHKRVFESALASGKMHHGWIFAGSRGLGKASFAGSVASQLVDPKHDYQALIERGSHPDIIRIARMPKDPPKEGDEADASAELKRSIGVDQIRALQSRMTTRPGISDKRVIIIDSADELERSAANALLKSLEEPPAGTYFILVSHSSDRLLPTIRSRCQMMRFEPLSDSDMEQALRSHLPDIGGERMKALIKAGAGSPGQALEYAGLDMETLEAEMAAILETGDLHNNLRNALSVTLSPKSQQSRYEAFLRRAPRLIAENIRQMDIASLASPLNAWEASNSLAARAISNSLDKQSVIFQMGTLLASLRAHKQPIK